MRAIRRFMVHTVLPDILRPLEELALNLRWTWRAPTRELFRGIDPELWEQLGRDPVAMLGAMDRRRLDELAADEAFVGRLTEEAANLHSYLSRPRWYQAQGHHLPGSFAYFSAEFGVAEALPQYSGGLGVLAGDHLKAASDLGVPIIGVGLLYASGYFRQSLTKDGWQAVTYPVLDADALPLSLLRHSDGSEARVELAHFGDRTLSARVWCAQVGRVPLLLLDSNVEGNDERSRRVTDRLYGGSSEHRLRQELLLGVGGVRALRIWSQITGSPAPEVFHCNEGHAGFLGIERISELTVDAGLDFGEALELVRSATVFTTHTAVGAGIDRYGMDLVSRYLGGGLFPAVPVGDVLALGREDFDGGDPGMFNMAVMGVRLSRRANGVSRLHGEMSRSMFHAMWPGFDVSEVPIESITNGVHGPSWLDPIVGETLQNAAGGAADIGDDADPLGWSDASDEQLWTMRRALRRNLVDEARDRLCRAWAERGASPVEFGWVADALDPDVLTIGFGRRVPGYKRLTLMLREPERLRGLLLHPTRPVQVLVAGKAHPADEEGIALIQRLVRFADDPSVRHRIVFLPDYDIALASRLCAGCDVWLNTPIRPLEACGTSGMKAALNGALNLSVMDGWWEEWYDPRFGWAIPSADGVADPEHRDDLEAREMYELIEGEIAPRFYQRDEKGLPLLWLHMVRDTLATLAPRLHATRMVREYVTRMYEPAARLTWELDGADYHGARDLAAWKRHVRGGWPGVRVDHVESVGLDGVAKVGDTMTIRAVIELGRLSPRDVAVQALLGRVSDNDEITKWRITTLPVVQHMDDGNYACAARVHLTEPGPLGYAVRIVPSHPRIGADTELGLIATTT